MTKYLLVIILFIGTFSLKGQDLHFSQYNLAPLLLNPSYTGFQDGNLRMNLNYRNQWFSTTSFATYAFSADANIIRDNLDYDMLGVGVSVFHDIEEKNGFSNTSINFSAAYNVKLTEKPLQYLGFGVQPSLLRKQINLSDAVYGTLFETGINTDPLGFGSFGGFKFDITMGLNYYVYFNSKHMVNIGFTTAHITQPNFAIVGNDNLYRKYAINFQSEFEAGPTGFIWVKPSLYFTSQGPSKELFPGLATRIQFYNAINEIFVGFGAGVRFVGHNSKALNATDFIGNVQFTYEQFTLGFSYDVTFSNLKEATGRNGGPELSLLVDLNFSNRNTPQYFRMISY